MILKKIEKENANPAAATVAPIVKDEDKATHKKIVEIVSGKQKEKESPVTPPSTKIKKFLEKEKMEPKDRQQLEQEEKNLTKEEVEKIKAYEAKIQRQTKEIMEKEATRGDPRARGF